MGNEGGAGNWEAAGHGNSWGNAGYGHGNNWEAAGHGNTWADKSHEGWGSSGSDEHVKSGRYYMPAFEHDYDCLTQRRMPLPKQAVQLYWAAMIFGLSVAVPIALLVHSTRKIARLSRPVGLTDDGYVKLAGSDHDLRFANQVLSGSILAILALIGIALVIFHLARDKYPRPRNTAGCDCR